MEFLIHVIVDDNLTEAELQAVQEEILDAVESSDSCVINAEVMPV
jgi:hypothetical protein